MLKKARIAVLVSGGGTNLEALLQAQEDGEIPHGEIVFVCASNEQAYALERAKNHGVPSAAIPKRELSQDAFEERLNKYMKEYRIDLIILAGFLTILSEQFVKQWQNRIINIHPSLIPSFCGKGMYGLKVHEAVLERGVQITGATVHLVNEIPDGGTILLQKAVSVKCDDTAEVLQRRVMEEAEWLLLPKAAEIMACQIIENDL